jgi:hypothetical protein
METKRETYLKIRSHLKVVVLGVACGDGRVVAHLLRKKADASLLVDVLEGLAQQRVERLG